MSLVIKFLNHAVKQTPQWPFRQNHSGKWTLFAPSSAWIEWILDQCLCLFEVAFLFFPQSLPSARSLLSSLVPTSFTPSPPALVSPSPLFTPSVFFFSPYPQQYMLTQTVVENLQVLKSFSFCTLACYQILCTQWPIYSDTSRWGLYIY